MLPTNLEDPLGSAKVCAGLAAEIELLGYSICVNSDLSLLSSARLTVRQSKVSPYFDPDISNLTADRFFWMSLKSADGTTASLQAYRYDYIDTSLSIWGPTYIIGLYMLRQELLLPSHVTPPSNSISNRLRGGLVYHGEFWVDPHVRSRQLFEKFSRLGIILSFIKWKPDAVWALSNKRMASHGHLARMGYPHLESGFLRWNWTSEEEHHIEWLSVADKLSIEQLIGEMNTGIG